MDGAKLLERFALLAEAPGGVARLRRVVLELAVRGKLGTQKAGDEPASVLLEQIAKERAKLVREGKLPKEKPPTPVGREEQAFALPRGWVWARLAALGTFVGGGTPSKSRPELWQGPIPWVSPKDMKVTHIGRSEDTVSLAALEESSVKWIEPGALLMVVRGMILAHSFPVAITTVGLTINQDMKALVLLDVRLAAHLLMSLQASRDRVLGLVERSSHGTCRIDSELLSKFVVPIAPIAEQYRIVDKVDELMALCDQLEQRLVARESFRSEARASAFAAATSASTLGASALPSLGRWSELVTQPKDVTAVRQLVLELAVRGKLGTQIVGDEPASVLLGQISNERAKLVREGKLPKEKPLTPVRQEEQPYKLPSGWAWARVGSIGRVQLGRQRSPSNHFGPDMRPYLRVANVHENRIDTSDVLQMNFSDDEFARFSLQDGDILLNEGQSYELVGRPAIYRGEVPGSCFQNTLVRFQAQARLVPEFALSVFRAYLHNGRFQRGAQQTTNIAHLSAGRLAEMEFPVPPLAEQYRIVAKVDELMALCDRLEASLLRRRDDHIALADSLAHHLPKDVAAAAQHVVRARSPRAVEIPQLFPD